MEKVKVLLDQTVEELRAIAHDSKDSRELRQGILILADELHEKSYEFNPDYVKVCSSEYPEEGYTYISREDYASSQTEWTVLG